MLYDLFKYSFKKAGEKAPARENAKEEEIWIDLGSADYSSDRKVFDHHHNEVSSAFSIVLQHVDDLDAIHSKGDWENKYTVVTHGNPDTDAIFTTWAVQKIISLGKDRFMAEYGHVIETVREYVDGIDSGLSDKIDMSSPCATIYVYICLMDEVLGREHAGNTARTLRKIGSRVEKLGIPRTEMFFDGIIKNDYRPCPEDRLKRGIDFADMAISRLVSGGYDLKKDPLGYDFDEILKKIIVDDIKLFDEDKNLTICKVKVPETKRVVRDGKEKVIYKLKEVQAAVWNGPSKSEFGYLYARQGIGRCTSPCVLTAVPSYDKYTGMLTNFRISFDRNNKESNNLTLLPLAVALEYMEQIEEIIEAQETHRTRRNYGAGRGGGIFEKAPFNAVSDPWYISDDYSIIDIPTSGTLIPEKDIIKMVCNNASILRNTAFVTINPGDAGKKVAEITESKESDYTCNLQEWIDDCRNRIKAFDRDGKSGSHMLICAEINAAIIPYNNYLLKYLCMSMAGLGFENYNEEKIMMVDRNTCIYTTEKFTLVLAATRTNDKHESISSEYEKDIFKICSEKTLSRADGDKDDKAETKAEGNGFSESLLMQSTIVGMLEKLLYFRSEFTDMCGKINELPYGKRKQIVKENDRLLSLMTDMLQEDIRKNEFEQSIYDYMKEQFSIEELKASVQACMSVVATDSGERTYNVFAILSGITIPFVLLCNLFQIGFLDFSPMLGTNGAETGEEARFALSFGWAWIGFFLLTALLAIVLLWFANKKRKK